jgi:hypothetical protein
MKTFYRNRPHHATNKNEKPAELRKQYPERAAGFTPAVRPHGGGEPRRSLNGGLIAQR